MKDFTNDDDVRTSKDATKDTGRRIRIDEGKTPIYILSRNYHDGFRHYVRLPSGDFTSVPCGGGEDGGGYAPDACPICAINKERWAKARALEKSGRSSKAKKLKESTNRQRGTYEMLLLAAKGETQVISIKGGKKRLKVDFEAPQVGILKLTQKQRDDLWSLPGSGQFEFMDSRKDLLNRYIVFDKAKRDDQDYATIQFIPASKPTPKPKFRLTEEDKEALDVKDDFAVDEDELERVADIILGKEEEPPEVDYEDDEEEEGEVDLEVDDDEEDAEDEETEEEEVDVFGVDEEDEEEIDLETDDEEEEEELSLDEDKDVALVEEDEEEEESNFDESFLDDIDEDFEDDLPWEEDEDEPSIPTKKKKTAAKKKTTSSSTSKKKQGTSKKKMGSESVSRSGGSVAKKKASAGSSKVSSAKKKTSTKKVKRPPKKADL